MTWCKNIKLLQITKPIILIQLVFIEYDIWIMSLTQLLFMFFQENLELRLLK